MDYSISSEAMYSMFPIPCDVVDKNLKLAKEHQIKVLLYFLRNSQNINVVSDCAKTLSLAENDITDSLDFWCSQGILQKAGQPAQKKESKKTPDKKISVSQKPSREDVVKRGSQSVEIKYMFQDVQMKLGRLLTQSELSTLIWLHDNQGLPIPVILLSVQHAAAEGKTNFSYIEKMCLDWVKHDVDTLDKAEARLNEVYMQRMAWSQVMSAFGIEKRRASEKEEEFAQKWVNEWSFSKDMLRLAYDKCVDSKQKISFAYINKILEGWFESKITKPSEVKELDEIATKPTKKKTSYSLDKIKQKVNQFEGVD